VGPPAGIKMAGVLVGPGGYIPLAKSSASQVWGHFLGNTSGLPYSVGGEVDMSYLGRSGSAEGEGQTVLGGGGGGAGGGLSFHFCCREGLVSPVGVGRDLLEACEAGSAMLGRWGGKGALAADGSREAISRRDA